jgi:TatD DNase family protein
MQDIHTHLYWESFDTDREAVLERAHAAGITAMLVVGTTLAESQKAIDLATKHRELFASVGVHPNEFRGERQQPGTDWSEELSKLAGQPKVVAIGECGLDYSQSHGTITDTEKEAQKMAFLEQIVIATKLHFPLIVHCRSTHAETDDAYQDTLDIIQRYSADLPAVVLHCYMGSQKVTEKFLAIPNIYFSFTGNITYPIKQTLRGGEYDFTESLKKAPLEKLFAETDCPFLAPQKYRGQRNEPAFVVEVLQKIADLKGISQDTVEAQLDQNFKHVFKKG